MDYDTFTELYEQQYADYRDDLHFYASLAERIGGPVLEIGAGSGRVSLFLARRGLEVVGLEPSGNMLQQARQKADASGLRVQWIQGDARTFALERTFPLIIAPFNALMHLYTPSDQLGAVQRIAAHLAPGGTFAFDLYVPHFGAMNTLRHEGETFHAPDGSRSDLFLLQRHDAARQLLTTEYFVDTTAPDGSLSRQHHTLTQRYYTRFEAEWLLRCAGLEVTKVAGSFQGGPVDENSEVMVFHATKSR